MWRSNRNGLSLVEVVVILAVLAVMLGLLLPALQAAQIFARRATCMNNLKMIGLACHNYYDVNGTLPMSRVDVPAAKPGVHGIGHSGLTALLPYMEQQPAYNAYNFSLENWHAANATVTRSRIEVFLCPDNKNDPKQLVEASAVPTLDGKGYPGQSQFASNHYAFNWGGGHKGFGDEFAKQKGTYLGLVMTIITAEGQKAGARNINFRDVSDGTSFTLLATEKRDGAGWAVGGFAGSEFDVNTTPSYQGDDAKAARVFTGSFHPGVLNVLTADGAVRSLSPTIEKPVWYALMTRAGGEEILPKHLGR